MVHRLLGLLGVPLGDCALSPAGERGYEEDAAEHLSPAAADLLLNPSWTSAAMGALPVTGTRLLHLWPACSCFSPARLLRLRPDLSACRALSADAAASARLAEAGTTHPGRRTAQPGTPLPPAQLSLVPGQLARSSTWPLYCSAGMLPHTAPYVQEHESRRAFVARILHRLVGSPAGSSQALCSAWLAVEACQALSAPQVRLTCSSCCRCCGRL